MRDNSSSPISWFNDSEWTKYECENGNEKNTMKGKSKEFTTDLCEWQEITELSDKQQALEIMSLCEITFF